MGARFTFTIPTGEEAGSGTANGPARLSTRSSRRMMGEHARILAVDDDPQALRYVRDALASAGYTPVVTGDPAEALRLVAEEKPDLVLFDLMLPGTDGIELMKDILGAGDVPVIFLSTYGRDELIAGPLTWGRSITSSSPSRRLSWRRGSGRPCASGRRLSRQSPTCWET